MLYNPDIYFVQTLKGFKRVSLERFNKINLDYAHTFVSNEEANYNLNVYIKPSLLFYTINKNSNKDMWQVLSDKWYAWFNQKLSEVGFDFDDVPEEENNEQGDAE